MLGSILEGSKMFGFVAQFIAGGNLEAASCGKFGGLSTSVLSGSLLLLVALTLVNVPLSLTHMAVGSVIGGSIACGIAVNAPYLWVVFSAWIVSPLLAAGLTFLIYRSVRSLVLHMSLPALDLFNRTAVTVVVFAMAYSLGANNVGFVNGLSGIRALDHLYTLSSLGAIALGAVVFGRGVSRTMGPDLVVLNPIGVVTGMFSSALLMWLFTQFTLPVSATQMVLGGMVGAGLAGRSLLLNKRVAFEIVGSWPLATLLSVIVGLLVTAQLKV